MDVSKLFLNAYVAYDIGDIKTKYIACTVWAMYVNPQGGTIILNSIKDNNKYIIDVINKDNTLIVEKIKNVLSNNESILQIQYETPNKLTSEDFVKLTDVLNYYSKKNKK